LGRRQTRRPVTVENLPRRKARGPTKRVAAAEPVSFGNEPFGNDATVGDVAASGGLPRNLRSAPGLRFALLSFSTPRTDEGGSTLVAGDADARRGLRHGS